MLSPSLLCLTATLVAVPVICAAPAAEARPRNIVLIMADDLGIEGLGCYGGSDYATPHLDQLAATGLRFSHAYSQPLCTPTRVQIMTGKYNQRNWQAFGILPQGEMTFGHMMSDFGYRTLIVGKWQLSSYDPVDFPRAERRRGIGTHPRDAGFDEYSLHHSEHHEEMGSRYANPTYLRNGVLHTDEGAYGEDVMVEYLTDFMTRHRDEPMFIYYPMSLPHGPMNPTPHSEAWSDPARRLEEDNQYFKDMVEYTDTVVGGVVAALEELGLREDTAVIFYSDNGTDKQHTSHIGNTAIRGGKASPRQTGIRVPLIVNWPAVTLQGITEDDMVDASDFLPTLADLAGREIPEGYGEDGQSFAPQIRGQIHASPREACFFWYDPRPGWGKTHLGRSIFALDQNYKLFSDGRLFMIDNLLPTERELDPDNLSSDAETSRGKLARVIEQMLQPPMSAAALTEVDAYGEPVN